MDLDRPFGQVAADIIHEELVFDSVTVFHDASKPWLAAVSDDAWAHLRDVHQYPARQVDVNNDGLEHGIHGDPADLLVYIGTDLSISESGLVAYLALHAGKRLFFAAPGDRYVGAEWMAVFAKAGFRYDQEASARLRRRFAVTGDHLTSHAFVFERIDPAAALPPAPPTPTASPAIGVASARSTPPGLCLCMIVKNEATVVRRCLDSVMPHIRTWLIVDTGSTDGTQGIIREHLSRIPGELVERPWKNFAHNRNEALDLCVGRASHVLVIDADDVLAVQGKFPAFTENTYALQVRHGPMEHPRLHIFRPELKAYRYEGALHEFINTPAGAFIQGAQIQIVGGGSRSRDPDKYLKDATLLEAELKKEPGNSRYQFYAAQSWRDYGDTDKAIISYARRVEMGGDQSEIFISLLEIARILDAKKRDPSLVLNAYLRAWELHPNRAEPLYSLGIYLRGMDRMALAASFLDTARKLIKPIALFVESAVYEWQALFQFSICANYVPGRRAQSVEACQRLLKCAPPEQHAQILENMTSSKTKLKAEGK